VVGNGGKAVTGVDSRGFMGLAFDTAAIGDTTPPNSCRRSAASAS